MKISVLKLWPIVTDVLALLLKSCVPSVRVLVVAPDAVLSWKLISTEPVWTSNFVESLKVVVPSLNA